jgi:hypothetical protein
MRKENRGLLETLIKVFSTGSNWKQESLVLDRVFFESLQPPISRPLFSGSKKGVCRGNLGTLALWGMGGIALELGVENRIFRPDFLFQCPITPGLGIHLFKFAQLSLTKSNFLSSGGEMGGRG